MKSAIIEYGQSLFDLALMHYGSADGVFLLVEDNPDLVSNWHDVPTPGTRIYIRQQPVDARVVAYFADNGIRPATLDSVFEIQDVLTTENDEPLETEEGVTLIT